MNFVDKKIIFSKIRKAKVAEKQSKILELCTSKTILDVGCVGQDVSYENPNWLHNQIKKICISIDGVDIEENGIKILKEKGYSIFHVNELSALNKKYDIILMSDVIEHVNDPVGFLSFYSKFLGESGVMIITTPNAHGIRNFSSIIIRNDYSLNPEHTFWFCPKTLTEVVDRASLNFVDFYWLKEYFKAKEIKSIIHRFIFWFNSVLAKLRSQFNPNFMYIISSK